MKAKRHSQHEKTPMPTPKSQTARETRGEVNDSNVEVLKEGRGHAQR